MGSACCSGARAKSQLSSPRPPSPPVSPSQGNSLRDPSGPGDSAACAELCSRRPSWAARCQPGLLVIFRAVLVAGAAGSGRRRTPRGIPLCPLVPPQARAVPTAITQPGPTVSFRAPSPPSRTRPHSARADPGFISEPDQPPLRPGPWLPPGQVALSGAAFISLKIRGFNMSLK